MTALAAIASGVIATALAGRAELAAAVDIAMMATEKRNTYPIIGCVRLKGDGDAMFLSGSNLDIAIDVRLPVAADSSFDVAIPAHLLKSLLKGAPKSATSVELTSPKMLRKSKPDYQKPIMANGAFVLEDGQKTYETIEFSEFDGPVLLDFAATTYKINALPCDQWPTLAGPAAITKAGAAAPGYRAFTIDGATLHAALDAVEFAISNEETRYYLNGVFLHSVAGKLRAVTTDGHRCARQEFPLPDGLADLPPFILHKATVALLLKLLKPAKGKSSPSVAVEVDDLRIRFMWDDITITAKLIEGTFPDYERVTPKQNDKFVTMSAAALLDAVAAASIVASERGGKAVKVSLSPGKCVLSVNNPDFGQAEATITTDHELESFEIGFNARYLVDCITMARGDGDEVTFELNDSGSPSIIRGGRAEWISVLMPMRV